MDAVCQSAGISRQGYYKSVKRYKDSNLIEERVLQLALEIRIRHSKMSLKKIYAKIKDQIKSYGIKMGRDKFITMMVSRGYGVRRKRRYALTTNSNHSNRTYPNQLKGNNVTNINQYWVSDITYLRTKQGHMYLNLVTDYYSRKIIGYSIGERLTTNYTVSALKMAYKTTQTIKGTIHHSDRGIQYSSSEYIQELKRMKILSSMTRGGSPHENAVAERINGILKQEYGISDSRNTKSQCRQLVKEAIYLYNEERPHLSLQMQTPSEFYNKCVKSV